MYTNLCLFFTVTFCLFTNCESSIRNITKQEIKQLKKNGYVLCKNLVSGEDLKKLVQQGHKISNKKNDDSENDIYFKNSYRKIEFFSMRENYDLEQVATHIPAKQIIDSTSNFIQRAFNGKRVRVLKDAFLSYSPGKRGCGWHVDDKFFWPSPRYEMAHNGINVWIALSRYRKNRGGGIAVSHESHRSFQATKAIDQLFHSGQTCFLDKLNPRLHSMLEKNKRTFDMNPGDALIMDRWCFHRTDNFTKKGITCYTNPLMRYSIRYMPENNKYLNPKMINGIKYVAKPLKLYGNRQFPIVYK